MAMAFSPALLCCRIGRQFQTVSTTQ